MSTPRPPRTPAPGPGNRAGTGRHHDSPAVRARQILVVLLAVNSGAIDAIGFLTLGGAFSSVMTGNMVLLGISVAHGDGALARNVGVALVCFVAGCALGARASGEPVPGEPVWPGPVRRVLAGELALTVLLLIGAVVTGPHRGAGAQLALLGCAAAALGVQSSAVQRFGVAGLSTTYLTGTLTTVASRLALREPVRNVGHSATILGGLIAGAVLGGLLTTTGSPWVLLLPVSLVGTTVLVPALIWREHR